MIDLQVFSLISLANHTRICANKSEGLIMKCCMICYKQISLWTSLMHPEQLQHILSDGLLSFPLTDFDARGDFEPIGYAKRLEWLMPYGASALFAAGGTGEFFSLTAEEYPQIIARAAQVCADQVPIIAGAGGPTRFAMQCAQAAEKAGAAGILLLPHYLTEAGQEGLAAHVQAVCRSTRLGVIVYNRGQCRLLSDTLAKLAETCPNLIGFKDGIGDIELMVSIYQRMGNRFSYLGGLPTAEVYAAAYKALGTPVYSSAVFNFIPKTALDFYAAVKSDDRATQDRLLQHFFLPYLAIRNQGAGFAVSIVKSGARIVGQSAGPVRAPLTELSSEQEAQLAKLIEALGPQSL
jgi:5-dehydro-4-deoxyglucarate dehydratase